jgi:hypothetical protein
MNHFGDKNFSERLQAAAKAKQAMLQRAAKPAADDPVALKKKAERQAIVAAREARVEAKARADAERAASDAAELAELAAASKLAAREEADRQVALLAEQKAARDARYAARKKRKA